METMTSIADVAELASADPVIIFTFDADAICTLSEGPGLASLGFRAGELVGTDLLGFYADEPLVRAVIERTLQGETLTAETETGGRLLQSYHQPTRDAEGRVTGGLGVVRDVTDQRRLEQQAETNQRRAAALVALSTALARDIDDPATLLQTAVTTAAEGTLAGGAVWLSSPHRDTLELAAWQSDARPGAPPPPSRSEVLAFGLTITRESVEAIDKARVVDLRTHDAADVFGTPLVQPRLEETGAHTLLRIPLRARDSLLGAMDLVRSAGSGPFSQPDIDFAVDIAERCVLALDNALLLQAHRNARDELVKFKALADATSDLIAIGDLEEEALYVNARVEEVGIDWAGRTLRDNFLNFVEEEVLEQIERTLADGDRWQGDLTLQLPGGATIVKTEAFRIEHPITAEPLGTVWVAQDITELRSVEAALRAANADLVQFKSLVEACPEFIAIAALDGTVKYVNPPGRAMVGVPADMDVESTSIVDYLTEEGIAASMAVEQPAVIEHGFWEGESTLRDWRGGPPIPVAIASFTIRDPGKGEPVALATVQRDLTDRIAAEEDLRELAEERQHLLTRLVSAQEAERAHIAAEVHDDSVQALAAVDLRLGLLSRRVQVEAPSLAQYVEPLRTTVSEATDRLRTLLFDLTPLDLDHGLGTTVSEAAREIFEGSPTRVSVVCPIEPELPLPVRRVAYRIAKEALFNVRKHARANQVVVTLLARGGGMEMTVTDDGVGIEEDSITTPAGHLGLSSMRDRAQIAGGTWSIRRGATGGTEVSLWLPGNDAR